MRVLLVLSAVLAFTSITFAGGGSPGRYFADTGGADTSTGTDTGATDGSDGSTPDTGGDTSAADGSDGSADGSDGSADGSDGSADGSDGSADGSGEGGGDGSTYTGDTAPLDPLVDEAGLTEWKGGGEEGGCSTVPGSSAGVGLALLGLLIGGRRRRSA